MGKNKNYTPAPQVPPEQMQRLALILEVLSGKRTVSQAARTLGMSRNHFQTILHRSVQAMVDSITPKAAGRPAKPPQLVAMQAELERLRRENAELLGQLGTADRLAKAMSGLLQGRIQASARAPRAKKAKERASDDKADPEPDARQRRSLQEVRDMRRLGLSASMAAAAAGVHPSTVQRWARREEEHRPLAHRRGVKRSDLGANAAPDAARLVRSLKGLIGADALRHSVQGLSRRQAGRVKAQTLAAMERERKAGLTKVSVSAPGIMRGMDGMHFHSATGRMYALFSADAAVPYRTSVKVGKRYNAQLVAQTLASDMEHNGAPLVYRLDRASAHDAPVVREVLQSHQVLVLHGPPRCPRFYGQLERLNREHRAWNEDLALLCGDELQARLEQILLAVNVTWRRRTLNWRTPHEAWIERPHVVVDRQLLREEVSDRAARIRRELQHRGKPADLAERLAIEQALQTRGLLRQEVGGWC